MLQGFLTESCLWLKGHNGSQEIVLWHPRDLMVPGCPQHDYPAWAMNYHQGIWDGTPLVSEQICLVHHLANKTDLQIDQPYAIREDGGVFTSTYKVCQWILPENANNVLSLLQQQLCSPYPSASSCRSCFFMQRSRAARADSLLVSALQ